MEPDDEEFVRFIEDAAAHQPLSAVEFAEAMQGLVEWLQLPRAEVIEIVNDVLGPEEGTP